MSKRSHYSSPLERQLCSPDSAYRTAKREVSERFLGVARRGRKIRLARISPEIMRNLVAVGVAEKRSDRQPTGEPAITFYVERKLPKSRLTRGTLLPRTVGGLTCDVVASGRVAPATSAAGNPWDVLDPLVPGAQIQVSGADAGTLGCFFRDADGELCMMSNCHVLSADLATGEGAPVYQPARNLPGSRRIGTVKRLVPIRADARNDVDLAIARIDPGVQVDPRFSDGSVLAGLAAPVRRDTVAKDGAMSGATRGRYDSIDTDVVVPYRVSTAIFRSTCVFRPSGFASLGDSGSMIYDPRTMMGVGLLFADSALLTYAIPVVPLATALGPVTWPAAW